MRRLNVLACRGDASLRRVRSGEGCLAGGALRMGRCEEDGVLSESDIPLGEGGIFGRCGGDELTA